jgi:hypothetical protein
MWSGSCEYGHEPSGESQPVERALTSQEGQTMIHCVSQLYDRKIWRTVIIQHTCIYNPNIKFIPVFLKEFNNNNNISVASVRE